MTMVEPPSTSSRFHIPSQEQTNQTPGATATSELAPSPTIVETLFMLASSPSSSPSPSLIQSHKEMNQSSAPTPVETIFASSSPSTTATTRSPAAPPGVRRPAGPILPDAQAAFFNLRSEADYLMVSVIPVLLSTLLAIPIQVFTSGLSRIVPFRALTLNHGAAATDSICLSLSGGGNPLSPAWLGLRFLYRFRDPLPLMAFLLGAASVILVPISSEVIRLEHTTDCGGPGDYPFTPRNRRICAIGLRKSGALIRVAEAMLVAMAVLVIGLGFLLKGWKSGVATEPWSIATMASLLASTKDDELRKLLPSLRTGGVDTQMEKSLQGKRFRLGFSSELGSRSKRYGLEVTTSPLRDDKPIRPTTRHPPTRKAASPHKTWSKAKNLLSPPKDMERYVRLLALLFTLGLLILILYYENTVAPDTPFEAFMHSQSFGVRILFTAFGTIITAFWSYYFSCR